MKLKIYIVNIDDNKDIHKEFYLITDSIPRILQMYENEVGEFEELLFSIEK